MSGEKIFYIRGNLAGVRSNAPYLEPDIRTSVNIKFERNEQGEWVKAENRQGLWPAGEYEIAEATLAIQLNDMLSASNEEE